MKLNSEILNSWNELIFSYPKIDIELAKKMLVDINNENNDNLKKEKRNYLICGTLYVIYDFISKNDFNIINSTTYDMNDIINSCCETWIEMIDDGTILNAKSYNDLFRVKFFSSVSNKILQREFSIHENMEVITVESFKDLFMVYLKMKQEKEEINSRDYMDELEKNRLSNRIIDKIYEEFDYFYQKDYFQEQIELILIAFENIYKSMDLDITDFCKIGKTKIDYFKYLLINNGYEYGNGDIEEVYIKDPMDDLVRQSYINELVEEVFNASNIKDINKKILEERFFYGKTLRETGKKFGMSRERVRQIEAKTLRKARDLEKLRKSREGIIV